MDGRKRVLVAHGSVRGSTAEIAAVVGEALTEAGYVVDVRDASAVDGLSEYDGVVLGGALYAGRWARRARRFVSRHVDELERMPVWLFSSGPLDGSASEGEIPPTRSVARYAERVRARDHVTFGGRLAPDARGFPASAMARNGHAGDFRDMDAVRAWATEIAEALDRAPLTSRPIAPNARGVRLSVAGLCLFTGITAALGGLELVLWPRGGIEWAPWLDPSILRASPFETFLVPGLLLGLVIGLLNLAAGVLTARRHRHGPPLAFVAGSALTIFILVELLWLPWSPLQGLYLAVGATTLWLAAEASVSRRRAVRGHGPPGALLPST